MKIPNILRPHVDGAHDHEEDTVLIGTCHPDGFAQITPRGSAQIYDDEHISLWERGRGSTDALLRDGTKVTAYFRKLQLRKDGILPVGGIVRFYGTATVHKSGPVYDKVWERLISHERKRDPDKKGWAVLIEVERVEDLFGQPLTLE